MKRKISIMNIIIILIIGMLLVLALFTLHDVSTAQGVGLYLALQKGSQNRMPYDIFIDIVGMVALLLVILIPFFRLKHRSVESLLRFMSAYFAFMPVLSMATMIHLFDGHNLLMIGFDWESNLNYLSGLVREVAPVFILLEAFYKKSDLCIKRWHWIVFAVQGVFVLGMCFLPKLAFLLWFMIYYMLLIVAYDWWEDLYVTEKQTALKVIFWVVFILFLCRGCFKMLDLTSHYTL